MNTSGNYTGLAKRLLDEGFMNAEALDVALAKAKSQKIRLLDYVIDNNLVDSDSFAISTSTIFGYPLLNLDAVNRELLPLDTIKEEVINKHHILPVSKSENELYIAVADPTEKLALDEIHFYSGKQVFPIIVSHKQLTKVIAEVQSNQTEFLFSKSEDINLDTIDLAGDEEKEKGGIAVDASDAPIIRFVHKILLDAINKGASDIHFEPFEKSFRIRFRMDGVLYEVSNPPTNLAGRICARIKVMSRLDISERRIPQDGRFKLNLSASRSMDFRVSSCPTVCGEKIVIRILDPNSAAIGIDSLGFEPTQKDLFLKYINLPQGMILVTGPTGSGKTVTMYTALHILNTTENNISTVEDPVEINVPGVNQVNINLKAGLTFATAMRAFLRQDPDIIMVGEMRDLETAEIGVKAAQTGHLVLSTLHTNSAPETLTRLSNMGLPPYNVATSVSMIIAQRLTRKLCSHCKLVDDLARDALHTETLSTPLDPNVQIYKHNSKGCEFCHEGYKGRIGIYEVLPVTAKISSAILAGANSMQLLELAKQEGMVCLREAGILKIQAGITTLDEINRVT